MRALVWTIIVVIVAAVAYWVGWREPPAPPAAETPPEAAPPAPAAPPPTLGLIDDARIINADSEPGNWLAHGRTYEERRFSPLTSIHRGNVAELGLQWYRDMGTNRALEATPIVVDGIMFLTSAWSRVHAIDALTGQEHWSYDPQVPKEWGRRACCDVVNRGVAVYNGRVYVGTLDGRLVALDAATGKKVWEVDTIIDRDRFYSITGAPRAAAGKVFIGNGGAEFGVRGYATAYDAATGDEVWRFFTVPGDPSLPFEHPEMEEAAATWKGGEWWEIGGGGTVWNSIVYDPDFDQVYLGVGNGAPWTRAIRSPGGGDNLFLSSIVALDVETGRKNWHYQTTPGDNWDYTAVQDMALAEMMVDGALTKVLLQAPKNGFFYVLDRADGRLLRAHPFAAVTWASHVDLETGRPVETPAGDYTESDKWVLPGPLGAHNWQAMSVDVEAGLVYLPAQDNPLIYGMPEEWRETGLYKRNPRGMNVGLEFGRITQLLIDNADTQPAAKGYLKAFNPLTGETPWTVEIPHYWNSGVVGTAGGLVFQGDALGYFNAYDKATGELLWQFNTHTSMLAPPITFDIDGTQYVSILTGTGGGDLFAGEALPPLATPASFTFGNAGRLLTFALGGTASLPAPTALDRTIPEQEAVALADAEIAQGERRYIEYCSFCHGLFVRSGGAVSDLRLMRPEAHAAFGQIVLDGIYSAQGMASYSDVLTEDDAARIQAYVRARAHEDREVALGNKEEARLTWFQ